MSFEVLTPTGAEKPIVVEVPHASLLVDAPALATMQVPARCIGQDADLLVDELYARAPQLGATMLIARVSRYVCDLNRSERDIDRLAVQGADPSARPAPNGLIWRQSTDGQPVLRSPLSRAEFERRLTQLYRPYHARLTELLQEKLARFGYVILLAAHSMPSSGRYGHGDRGSRRADVVPGSRGKSTAAEQVVHCPELLAKEFGWSVAHDEPYRGGFTTANYAEPHRGVHALQVELNRYLYMDEDSLTHREPGFERTRDYCTELVRRLAEIPAELLLPS